MASSFRRRFAEYLPWPGEPWLIGRWSRAPAHLVYFGGTGLLFLVYLVAFGRERDAVPQYLYEFFVFEIPALTSDVPRTLVNLVTSVWLNTHPLQVAYVVILLVLFGVPFEAREGTRRAVLVFYVSSVLAGLWAGFLLILLQAWFDAAWIDRAWHDPWTGGSAGAFGLLGASAARAPRPWLLMVVVGAWELYVEWFHLRSYTPAFHAAALAVGFLLTRYVLLPRPEVGPRGPVRGLAQS